MRSGWTGGQFSIWRAGMALSTLVYLLPRYETGPNWLPQMAVGWPWITLIALTATLLLLGWLSRPAAIILMVLTALAPAEGPLLNLPLTLVLALFLTIQPAPYGSLKAKGRQDPGGSWTLDPLIRMGAWILWVGLFSMFTLNLQQPQEVAPLLAAMPLPRQILTGIVFLTMPFTFSRSIRPWAWLILFLGQILLLSLGQNLVLWPALWLLVLAADPQWLAAKDRAHPEMVFYDGSCGLCHRSCRFLLSEDVENKQFQFAPIGGFTFKETIDPQAQTGLPDSILVHRQGGVIFSEFRAVKHLLYVLGGFWRILAWIAHLIPISIGNSLYRFIARNRKKVFADPSETCPVLPPHLRKLFHA